MHAQIHHISILNRLIQPTFEFYHNTLGLKLLMKTINQDDDTMYHLFFADDQQRTGTEISFFEMSEGADKTFGTNTIERTILKVPSEASLTYWMERFDAQAVCHYGVEQFNGRPMLRFEGPDTTQMALVPLRAFEKVTDFYPATHSDVPSEHGILGIDAIQLRVQYTQATADVLQKYLQWQEQTTVPFFETTQTVKVLGNGDETYYQEVHLIDDRIHEIATEGVGGVHHVAFGVADMAALEQVDQQLNEKNFTNSGIKEREFFQALYFREPNQLLFEVATQEGHIDPIAYANQSKNFADIDLYLPGFLEGKRRVIEDVLNKQRHN